jgi:LacI family transcriptional regulator
MATIKDVAKQARVSVGTVSNVISGAVPVRPELRRRVDAAIQQLDYHPNYVARSLKVKRTRTLGMMISDITNPFFPELVRGAEDACLEKGYFLFTLNTDDRVDQERRVLSLLRSRRVDGILLVVSPGQGDPRHIIKTLEAGIPIVALDRIVPGLHLDSVSVDNVKGARVCVRHLLMMGHRKVAIIGGSPTLQTAQDRLQGYLEALIEANIDVDPELILAGDFRQESGYLLGKDLLLRRDRPTALFVSNGMMTLGVLEAMEEIGLSCPGDLALATFDDLRIARFFRPHLTSVVQPAHMIGYQGATLLIQRVLGEIDSQVPVSIRLDPELKIRESSYIGPGQRHPVSR